MTTSPKLNRPLLERAIESALTPEDGDGPVRVVVDDRGRTRATNQIYGSDLELLSVTEVLRLRRACEGNGGDVRDFSEVYARWQGIDLERRFHQLLETVAV